MSHYFSTMGAGAGADIHNVVGLQHGILIMFYHNQRIAKIS